MSRYLRVLLIEDSEEDAELLLRQIARGDFEVEFNRVDTMPALKEALDRTEWNLILSDYSMPRLSGLQALKLVREVNSDVPFIVVSGAIGEEVAVELMRSGAQDFIQKGNWIRLLPVIDRELSEAENRLKRRLAEQDRVRLEKERTQLLEREMQSQKRVKRLIDSEIVGIFFYEGKKIVDANSAFLKMIGYTNEDLQKQNLNWSDLTPREWNASDELGWKQLVSVGVMRPFEKEFYDRYGNRVPVFIGAANFEDSKVNGIAYVLNLTQQKELEAQFEVMANSIPQLAWMANPHGNIFWYNQRWYDYTGMTIEKMQTSSWMSVHHSDHRERVLESLNHSWKTGEPWEDTFPIKSRSGEWRWFLSRALPIKDSNNRIVRWFGTHTDVTEQLNIQEELKKTESALRTAVKTRDEFISIASHELKTPLTSLNIQIQVLERITAKNDFESVKRKLPEYFSLSRRQLGRLTRLIEDMLDVSRIATAQLRIELIRSNLSDAVRGAVTRLSNEAISHNCTIEVDIPSDLYGDWDLFRLEQAIYNLISNAIKYGGRGTIGVHVFSRDEIVRIEIIDHGPGIDKKDQRRVFNRFERAISANEVSGLGLGLYISRQIIEAHQGKIWVESEPGQGAQFIIEMPLHTQNKPFNKAS